MKKKKLVRLEQLEYEAYGCHTEIKMIKKTIRLDDYFKISSDALQTFTGLSKVGVFHRDIESILEQMKVIKADINKWWTNEILQIEVKLFLEAHAKSLNDPKNWLKSFCKI